MKLKGTLIAAGIATLISAFSPIPAHASAPATAPASATASATVFLATRPAPANLLGGSCSPGIYSPTSSNGTITLTAFVQCWSSIDFAFINMQLRRIVGGFDNGESTATCMTTTSWDLSCSSSVQCQTGYYYGVAEFEASSTSGYTESETQTTPGRLITC